MLLRLIASFGEDSGRLAESRNEGEIGRRGEWATTCRRGEETLGRPGAAGRKAIGRFGNLAIGGFVD